MWCFCLILGIGQAALSAAGTYGAFKAPVGGTGGSKFGIGKTGLKGPSNPLKTPFPGLAIGG